MIHLFHVDEPRYSRRAFDMFVDGTFNLILGVIVIGYGCFNLLGGHIDRESVGAVALGALLVVWGYFRRKEADAADEDDDA